MTAHSAYYSYYPCHFGLDVYLTTHADRLAHSREGQGPAVLRHYSIHATYYTAWFFFFLERATKTSVAWRRRGHERACREQWLDATRRRLLFYAPARRLASGLPAAVASLTPSTHVLAASTIHYARYWWFFKTGAMPAILP